MIKDKFGQQIFSENEVLDIIMQGIEIDRLNVLVNDFDTKELDNFQNYKESSLSVSDFDKQNQGNWYMPQEYKDFDIAQYILEQCVQEHELQRCGKELLMYQERGLFDMLRYLKYLVDTMKKHNIIWGVGRGSSVASYVLYKLEIHKVDSIFYKLDVEEFLR